MQGGHMSSTETAAPIGQREQWDDYYASLPTAEMAIRPELDLAEALHATAGRKAIVIAPSVNWNWMRLHPRQWMAGFADAGYRLLFCWSSKQRTIRGKSPHGSLP